VPRQLPAPTRGFAGRETEIAELDGLLSDAGKPSAVLITAISGTGGIGKTALALEWAHRVAERFPDGQLYTNLRGFDPSGTVVEPGEAVRTFLEALGVERQQMPTTIDAQVGLYRSLLADRRILVVLDNARDVEPLRPLLPGAPGCLALVTSRSLLGGLVVTDGAVPLGLDLLSRDEAWTLLANRLGAPRLAAEPDAAEQIIAFCGRLPLALAVVAARAALRRGALLDVLAEELRDVRGRLDALQVGDRATDVRAVFSWSYRALGPEAARLFRLLGLHPGPDISVPAAASLSAQPESLVGALVADLLAAHMVTDAGSGRYSFHDLLRAYAAEVAASDEPADDRDGARRRMLGHYLRTADTADHLIYPHRDPVTLPEVEPGHEAEQLSDATAALQWFARETPVLLAVARQARSWGDEAYPGLLLWTLVNYLDRSGLWPQWVDVQQAALSSADRVHDLPGQALAHRGLAHAYLQLGRYDDSTLHGCHALDLYRALGDKAGEAQTHLMLGGNAARSGDNRTASTQFLHAAALYEALGHEAGRANALNNAGFVCTMHGDYAKAVTLCQEAVDILQRIGNRYGLGASWDSLGYAHHHLGHHDDAVACYGHALALARENGDRYIEAETLAHLGDTHDAAGDAGAAQAAWTGALDIYDDLGHPEAVRLRTALATQAGRSAQA
jgi:tetratricopeptide (TPR) repeat protein